MRILEGILVLDATNVLAGPFVGYQLALLGADTIKVEHPKGGDLARKLGASPEWSQKLLGVSFLAQNANKRSIGIDLKSPGGKEVFKKLVAKADVLVENFRPGVMDRLGLGYQELVKVKNDLIYCAISGFGQDGPLSQNPAYDQIIQGKSGLMSVTGSKNTGPLRVGIPIADTVGGLTAGMAILGALYYRTQTGKGQMVDISLLDSLFPMMGWILSNLLIGGEKPKRMGNENFTAAPSGTFKTKKGELNITANKDEHWQELCRLLGAEELLNDPRFSERDTRKSNRYVLRDILNERLKEKTAEQWEQILNEHGIPSGTVLSLEEAIRQPQIQHRRLLRVIEDTELGEIFVCGLAAKFSEANPPEPVFPPRLGEHTDQIMKWLGYVDEDIRNLRQKGEIK